MPTEESTTIDQTADRMSSLRGRLGALLTPRALPRTLFSVALFVYLVALIIVRSMVVSLLPSRFMAAASAFSILVLFVCELIAVHGALRQYVRPQGIAMIVGLLVAAVSSALSGEGTILMLALFVVVARHFDFRDIARVALTAMMVACVIVVASVIVNPSFDYVWTQEGGSRVRHGLGFRYATYLSHFVLYGTLLYAFIRRGHLSPWAVLIILGVDMLVYVATDSRNSFALTAAVLVACVVLRPWTAKTKGLSRPCAVAWSLVFPVLAIVSVAAMIFYDPSMPVMSAANDILGNRINLSNYSFTQYGVTPLGQEIVFTGNGLGADLVQDYGKVTFIDNSYCLVLVRQGVIFFLLALALFTMLTYTTARHGDRLTLILLTVVAVHSCVDPMWLAPQYDVLALLIGSSLIRGAMGRVQTARFKPRHREAASDETRKEIG